MRIEASQIKVSPEHQHLLIGIAWHLSRGYVRGKVPGPDGRKLKIEYLHRLITSAPAGAEVDHINGDRTDNRLENLRLCSHKENTQGRFKRKLHPENSSGYLGVSPYRGKWRARIRVEGRMKCLGVHADVIEAAKAYDAAAFKHWGQFATINFPKP